MKPSLFAHAALVAMVSMLCVPGGAPAQAATWYVAPSGSDGSDCQSTATPCLTINGAIGKAGSGDTVRVGEGTYTAASGGEVVSIRKRIALSGGWDADFAAQAGTSIIDGGGARRGLHVEGIDGVTIDHFTIEHGFHDFEGGGIFLWGAALTLNDCAIRGNVSLETAGGIYAAMGGVLTLNNSTISGNVAGNPSWCAYGGGAMFFSGSTVVLNNSTVSGNSTIGNCGGSGIHVWGNSLEVNNSTVSGNFGTGGEGIKLSYGSLSLRNSTIGFNQGTGLVNLSGSVDLQNTIIAGNGLTDCSGTAMSGGYNLVGNGEGCSIIAGSGDQIGNSSAPIDPRLLPLNAYGGPTLTHGLRFGSPALDAGNPAAPGSGGNACLATDQRGQSRPEGSACDIGAFEGRVAAVASITRAHPNPSIAANVDFTVAFTEAVTGVDTAPPFDDFALATTGVSGAAITAVTGSGDTYTVSVSTGTGDGTIRLDLVDDDSILNDIGVPVGGPGHGNGDHVGGESYTILGNPRIISIVRTSPDPTNAASVNFTVVFTESVTGVDLSPPFGDFALTTTGLTTGAVSAVSGAGDTYTVTVALDAHFGNGTVRLDVVDDGSIVDAFGNPLGGEGAGNGNFTSGERYAVLTIPPPLSPTGRIPTARPVLAWTQVPGATQYRYQLFKGTRVIYTRIVSSGVCAGAVCSNTPKASLGMGPHKWRVQGKVGGTWTKYSAKQSFTVSPRAGSWKGRAFQFSVAPDLATIRDFALYIGVKGCGTYKITHLPQVPITNSRFAFRGPFYASGAFSSPTGVSAKYGLRSFSIPGCGRITGGPYSRKGTWKGPAQLMLATADSDPDPDAPLPAYPAESFAVESIPDSLAPGLDGPFDYVESVDP